MLTETLEKEFRSTKSENFDKLQTNKIENINLNIENLLPNVEDTFIKTTRKVIRKTRIVKEIDVKIEKVKMKK